MPTFSSLFALQRSDLPPWPPGIEAGQLPWLPGYQNMVGLSESTVPVWWLINADHRFPMINMVSLFDMSFWDIPPLTHVDHLICVIVWRDDIPYSCKALFIFGGCFITPYPRQNGRVKSSVTRRAEMEAEDWNHQATDCHPIIVVSCWLTVHIPIFLVQFWFLNICCWNLFPVLPVTVQLSSCFSCRTKPTFSPRCEGQRLTSVAVFFRGQAWNSEKHDGKLKLLKWLKDAFKFQSVNCFILWGDSCGVSSNCPQRLKQKSRRMWSQSSGAGWGSTFTYRREGLGVRTRQRCRRQVSHG